MTGNLLPVLAGVPLMALFCWALTYWFPLLESEANAHAQSLSIDGLRGILATSVFFHHAFITYIYLQTGRWMLPSFNDYAQLGPTAVTVFFFISGFLFWRKALRNPSSLRLSVLLPNRFRRILPAYWLAAALTFTLAGFLTHFHLQESSAKVGVEAVRWVFAGFPGLDSPKINGLDSVETASTVFWTLRLEWMFYLLLPLLLWFRKLQKLLLLLVVLFAIHQILGRLPATSPEITKISDIVRTFILLFVTSFSVGMIAAYDFWRERCARGLSSPVAAFCGVLLVALQLLYVPAVFNAKEPILLIPVFFMVVAGNTFFGVLSSRPMRCLGQISYSLYIFHGIILLFLILALNRIHPVAGIALFNYWALVVAIGLIVVVVCTLSYWFVERPFLPRSPVHILSKSKPGS